MYGLNSTVPVLVEWIICTLQGVRIKQYRTCTCRMDFNRNQRQVFVLYKVYGLNTEQCSTCTCKMDYNRNQHQAFVLYKVYGLNSTEPVLVEWIITGTNVKYLYSTRCTG